MLQKRQKVLARAPSTRDPTETSRLRVVVARGVVASSADQTGGARCGVGIPDWHNRLVLGAVIPSHHLFWTVKLDDDDTAGGAPTLDRFGLTTPYQNAAAELFHGWQHTRAICFICFRVSNVDFTQKIAFGHVGLPHRRIQI